MADKSLVMTFLNVEGTRASISVPGVRSNLTEQEVSIVMDSIIAGNIFSSTGGDLVSKQSAQVTERNITALSVK